MKAGKRVAGTCLTQTFDVGRALVGALAVGIAGRLWSMLSILRKTG